MTRYIGMDVHKRQIVICIVDRKGKVLKRSRCASTPENLKKNNRNQFNKKETWHYRRPRKRGQWPT